MATNNWKTKFFIRGALIGAVLGLITAYLLARNAEENSTEPPEIATMDALKATIGLIGVIRGIAALGNKNNQ
ncbi:MAG TPA: hypothetical protein VLL52_20860 [Anaerolineae bacterium]|nr:hypothetical protein [Anaerolineae bacterium]